MLRNELNEASSLLVKFKSVFRRSKVNIPQIESKIGSQDAELLDLNEALEVNQQKIYNLHSFWQTYPPDWEGRKKAVREKTYNLCEYCGTEHGERHVHHKIPISKGGNHNLSNLEYICVDCHSEVHGGRDVSTENKVLHDNNKSSFQKKVDLIQDAIDNGKVLNFNYQKFHGDKSVRSITPEGFDQRGKSLCVYGYCYLRDESRIFAIKRMKKLRISDSPRN
tara:strand:- start:100 stop:765 length:666 start_codon:yes stop_codon:yes gene_type:complete